MSFTTTAAPATAAQIARYIAGARELFVPNELMTLDYVASLVKFCIQSKPKLLWDRRGWMVAVIGDTTIFSSRLVFNKNLSAVDSELTVYLETLHWVMLWQLVGRAESEVIPGFNVDQKQQMFQNELEYHDFLGKAIRALTGKQSFEQLTDEELIAALTEVYPMLPEIVAMRRQVEPGVRQEIVSGHQVASSSQQGEKTVDKTVAKSSVKPVAKQTTKPRTARTVRTVRFA